MQWRECPDLDRCRRLDFWGSRHAEYLHGDEYMGDSWMAFQRHFGCVYDWRIGLTRAAQYWTKHQQHQLVFPRRRRAICSHTSAGSGHIDRRQLHQRRGTLRSHHGQSRRNTLFRFTRKPVCLNDSIRLQWRRFLHGLGSGADADWDSNLFGLFFQHERDGAIKCCLHEHHKQLRPDRIRRGWSFSSYQHSSGCAPFASRPSLGLLYRAECFRIRTRQCWQLANGGMYRPRRQFQSIHHEKFPQFLASGNV